MATAGWKGCRLYTLFLLVLIFQLLILAYQFLFFNDDIQLKHDVHKRHTKQEFVGSKSAASAPTLPVSGLYPLFNQTREPLDDEAGEGTSSRRGVRKRLNREQKRVNRLKKRMKQVASTMANLTSPLYQQNYFDLTRDLYPGFPMIPELLPLKIMSLWLIANENTKLEKEWMDCGNSTPCPLLERRKFIVGTYSCPLEAGNRLHKFMNSLVWAVLTRRTFLWDYFDQEACRLEQEELAEGTCDSFLNTEEECQDILILNDWVPSWQVWKQRLQLPTPIRACGLGNRDRDAMAMPIDADDRPQVLRVGQQINLETGVVVGNANNNYRHKLLEKKSSINSALQFFKQGFYFTYGMLFEALFTLHPSLLPEEELVERLSKADTYFLHSRHPPSRLDPKDIGLEVQCMEQLLKKRKNSDKPCLVMVMTDRAAARPLLEASLKDYNCTALFSANTTRGSNPFRNEHGNFAGRGYFQDLAMVRQARSGFLAPHLALRQGLGIRTSSGLPREVVEFRRVLESASWDDITEFGECVGNVVRDENATEE